MDVNGAENVFKRRGKHTFQVALDILYNRCQPCIPECSRIHFSVSDILTLGIMKGVVKPVRHSETSKRLKLLLGQTIKSDSKMRSRIFVHHFGDS